MCSDKACSLMGVLMLFPQLVSMIFSFWTPLCFFREILFLYYSISLCFETWIFVNIHLVFDFLCILPFFWIPWIVRGYFKQKSRSFYFNYFFLVGKGVWWWLVKNDLKLIFHDLWKPKMNILCILLRFKA